jgi:RNase P subunit RPR2
MHHCPKCRGMLVFEVGLSTADRRGDEYRYIRCVICGWVGHVGTKVRDGETIHIRLYQPVHTL